jgi:para-nitrobenzyl esterase
MVLDPEVETIYGRISGSENGGIRSFRGIPYARPPLGPDRFRGPGAPEPWTEVFKANRAGRVPIQASVPWLSFLNAGAAPQSEECLYLNVWTPGLDMAKRPVLVWVHGGGFLIGAGSTPIYEGHNLAHRGDIVVVTFNYRLGALGYIHLNGVGGDDFRDASNAGVRDQIAALEWVRDNIASFGGDPGNVTVAGQSAGAMSIGALLGAPRARALFKRAVCQSGAMEHLLTQDEADEAASIFLRELGGPPREVDVLARIPVEKILKAQGVVNQELTNIERLMAFLPCVDGDLIPEHPLDAVRKGAVAHIPILLGTTLDEWKLFTALDSGLPTLNEDELVKRFEGMLPHVAAGAPDATRAADLYREAVRARGGKTSAYEVWSAFQSARVFHYPSWQLAQEQSKAGGTAYSYLFTWRPPALRRTLGACHALDIPFIFGFTNHPVAIPFTGLSPAANRLSRRMQHAWINFARCGDPGHEQLPSWPAYDTHSRATMVFGRKSYLDHAPLEDERKLFESWT